jgi:hypothetical protein
MGRASEDNSVGSLSTPTPIRATTSAASTLTTIDATQPLDDAARQATVDFAKGIEAVQIRDEMIRAQLAQLHFDLNTTETTDILIRHLAYAQAVYTAERVYRLIFGSQLSLLRALNIEVSRTDLQIRPFYEKARKNNPKF